MKRLILLFFIFFSCLEINAQVPQGISYQAVANNSSGTPLSAGTAIKVRFSIYDNSASGTLIYREVHTTTTYAQGVYSVNIGQGTPSTGTFSSIVWGINLKFLKVEHDITNTGSSYTTIGTSQLMSVPYALYALNASKTENSNPATSVVTLQNVTELKNYTGFDKTKPCTVYLLGYNYPSDGGGGTFIFRTKQNMKDAGPSPIPAGYYPDDDNGLFIKSNVIAYDVTDDAQNLTDKGLWVRQFEGDINLRYYGEIGFGGDCTASLQKAIDFASLSTGDTKTRPFGYNRSHTVYLPNGDWRITQIYLKSGVSLKGCSKENTSIKSLGYNNNPMIQIAPGPVLDVHISGIKFVGEIGEKKAAPSTVKTCFYIKAQSDGAQSAGGLWNATFKDIDILRFGGNGLHFEGGTGTTVENIKYQLTNQFITFENVHVESIGHERKTYPDFYNNYHALAIQGMAGQFHFTNCRFDGGSYLFGDVNQGWEEPYKVTGQAIYIGPVNAENNEIATPTMINFYTCTIQAAETGILIDGAQNITIQGCWFETMERAISVIGRTRPSRSINVANNLFGRTAGSYGILEANSGSVITYENANINVMNNNTNNHVDDFNPEEIVQFIRLENQQDGTPGRNLGINTFGNDFEEDRLRFTQGVKQDILVTNVSTSTIETKGSKLIFINNPLGTVYTVDEILSHVAAGELICIRAINGDVKFTQTKNIWLGNMIDPLGTNNVNEFTLNNGGYALFVKADDQVGTYRETYNLVTYKNAQ